MSEAKVWVFFYGSYINLDVLKEVDLVPEVYETASLAGYDLVIAPRANLMISEQATVYGILATASHAELDRLYSEHAHGKLGEHYLPEAVLTRAADGKLRAALTYISHDMRPAPVEADYVECIAAPAKAYGFPKWYVDKIQSFCPKA